MGIEAFLATARRARVHRSIPFGFEAPTERAMPPLTRSKTAEYEAFVNRSSTGTTGPGVVTRGQTRSKNAEYEAFLASLKPYNRVIRPAVHLTKDKVRRLFLAIVGRNSEREWYMKRDYIVRGFRPLFGQAGMGGACLARGGNL